MQTGKIEASTIIPIAVAIFFVGGLIWLFSGSTDTAPVNTGTWSRGNLESSIELVEFSDFECPACAAAHPTIQAIDEKYSDKIKFTYKHFPLRSIHPHAFKFALAAEAAGNQGKFFEFVDIVFSNHTDIFDSQSPEDRMLELMEGIEGLDFNRFKSEFVDEIYKGDVLEDEAEVTKLGLNSTPSFVLNGEILDLTTFADLDTLIQEAIDALPDTEGADTTQDSNDDAEVPAAQ